MKNIIKLEKSHVPFTVKIYDVRLTYYIVSPILQRDGVPFRFNVLRCSLFLLREWWPSVTFVSIQIKCKFTKQRNKTCTFTKTESQRCADVAFAYIYNVDCASKPILA